MSVHGLLVGMAVLLLTEIPPPPPPTFKWDVAVVQPAVADALNAGTLTRPVWAYGYDADGNMTSITDPRGRTTTLRYDDIAQADLVIEAVFENMDIKQEVFRKLDAVCKPGAILATNTSTLDVDEIASVTQRPQDVIGMHFFSPANVMKLLEVVRGDKTAKDVMATVMTVAKKIKKTAVVSGVCDGFIGNRMIEQYGRQGGFLLDEGCTPEQVDKAIEKFGFAMGPFRMGDLAGNDIGWAIRKRRYVEQPDIRYCARRAASARRSAKAGTTTCRASATRSRTPRSSR